MESFLIKNQRIKNVWSTLIFKDTNKWFLLKGDFLDRVTENNSNKKSSDDGETLNNVSREMKFDFVAHARKSVRKKTVINTYLENTITASWFVFFCRKSRWIMWKNAVKIRQKKARKWTRMFDGEIIARVDKLLSIRV